ncbi:MAG: hypothetical protein WCK43_04680 [bacterium]
MKKLLLLATLFSFSSFAAKDSKTITKVATPKEDLGLPKIEVKTESINGITTWVLKDKNIEAGKTYLLSAKHDLTTGPEEHGLEIKDFGVKTSVKRGVAYKILVNVPADKKGEVKISCFLHPKHKEATLIVK